MSQQPERGVYHQVEIESVIDGIGPRLTDLLMKAEIKFAPGEQYRVALACAQVAFHHPEYGITATKIEELLRPIVYYHPLEVHYNSHTYICPAYRGQFRPHDQPRKPGEICKGGIRIAQAKSLDINPTTHIVADEEDASLFALDDMGGLGLGMLDKVLGMDLRDLIDHTNLREVLPGLPPELDAKHGAKGVVVVPRSVHAEDHAAFAKQVMRQYGRAFTFDEVLDPRLDVAAPDQYTTGSGVIDGVVMGHAEALGEMHIDRPPHEVVAVVTGKTLEIGGHEARATATAFGTMAAIRIWAEANGVDLDDTVAVIDGAGNAALPVAEMLTGVGATVVGITDSRSVVSAPAGLQPKDYLRIREIKRNPRKSLADFARETGGRVISLADSEVEAEVEEGKRRLWSASGAHILVLSSSERVLNAENVEYLPQTLMVVAAGANGPVTPIAEHALTKKKVAYLTGSYANAGGVIVSTFAEWLGNMANGTVPVPMAKEAVTYAMERNFGRMVKLMQEGKVQSLEQAFYYMVVEKYFREQTQVVS